MLNKFRPLGFYFKRILVKKPLIGLLQIMVLIIFIWIFLDGIFFFTIKEDERGPFGDMFGAINSLFSGLALAGIIFTILLQIRELKLQRHELKLTRREFSKQSDEFKIQNSTLKIQRFENTFFQLLSSHYEMVNNIRRLKENEIIGNKYFKEVYDSLNYIYKLHKVYPVDKMYSKNFEEYIKSFDTIENYEKSIRRIKPFINLESESEGIKYKNHAKSLELLGLKHTEEILNNHVDGFIAKYYVFKEDKQLVFNFNQIYFDNQDILGRYFRSLYHIYKMIATSELITNDESQFYSDLVSAQLSEYEMVILAYNCIEGANGFPNFTWLVKKLNILENLNMDLMLFSEEIINSLEKINIDDIPNTLKIGRLLK